MSDYLPGGIFGLPENVRVHRLANIVAKKFICGEGCRIDAFVTITGDVELGARVHIGVGACIFASSAKVTIGDGSGLSPWRVRSVPCSEWNYTPAPGEKLEGRVVLHYKGDRKGRMIAEWGDAFPAARSANEP